MLHIKHSGKTYDLPVTGASTGNEIMSKLAELTQVPVDRQKIVIKGKPLQLTDTVEQLKLNEKTKLFMIGTAQKIAAPQTTENVPQLPEFKEELRPLGLVNVGNTCYAASTLQALHTVPEFVDQINNYSGTNGLIKSWAELISQFGYPKPLDEDSPEPTNFMRQLRLQYPQFGETGDFGLFKQQDAEELWTQLLTVLDNEGISTKGFEGQFEVNKKGELSSEQFSKLMCHITSNTNFLKDGLKTSLIEERETSEGNYEVTRKISRFPKYLTVQFVRFFWRRNTQTNSKILRKVTFPTQLDIGDLATEDLQKTMAPVRETYRELESAIEEVKRSERRAKYKKMDTLKSSDGETSAAKRAAIEAEEQGEQLEKQRVKDLRAKFDQQSAELQENDDTKSPHGLYTLNAVVTHQGTSADSGHYQCFVRNQEKPNSWWRFNDDKVSEVDDAKIASLAGGGASDSALILLYKSANE